MKFVARLFASLAVALLLLSAALAGEGKVISKIDAAGYTYIEVDQDGKKIWIATEVVPVKPGQQVRFDDGVVMRNFHSSALERNFPEVLFVGELKVIPEK